MPIGIFFDIHLFSKLKVIHFPLSCYLVKVITRTNELMENSSEQRRKQEKILEERLEQINKLEATVKSVSAEVIKVCHTPFLHCFYDEQLFFIASRFCNKFKIRPETDNYWVCLSSSKNFARHYP